MNDYFCHKKGVMNAKDLESQIDQLERLHQHNMEQIAHTESVRNLQKFQELQQELQKTRQELLRYLVATSGMIFSILIGLSKSEAHLPLVRWSFAISIVLLGLGILLLSIALYSLLYLRRRGLTLYGKAVEKAHTERRPVEKIHRVNEPRFFAICEKIGLVCLALAVIALMVSVVIQQLG